VVADAQQHAPPTPASSSITSAETFAQFGLGASLLTGIPGLGVAGAALGTERDIQNFAGPYGAPTFKDPSRLEHMASALSGGWFGQNVREQATAQAAGINPSVNPADVYSAVTTGLRSFRPPTVVDPVARDVDRGNREGRTPGGSRGRREARSRGYGSRAR